MWGLGTLSHCRSFFFSLFSFEGKGAPVLCGAVMWLFLVWVYEHWRYTLAGFGQASRSLLDSSSGRFGVGIFGTSTLILCVSF
jgi:hypothetical protein